MQKRQWLNEHADLSLRSDDGGRALFWYGRAPALLMIDDPAGAGLLIELTTPQEAQAEGRRLIALGWRRDES